MKIAPLPPNEEERLKAVRQLGLFDTLPEKDFERPHQRFLDWHRENCFKG